jgi:hypothetical protein
VKGENYSFSFDFYAPTASEGNLQSEDEPDRERRTLALSYLRQLKESGYFSKPHSFCDGEWFPEHPACKDNDTWRSVECYLVAHGYVTIERMSFEELQKQNVHPRDWNDAWWFRLTPA